MKVHDTPPSQPAVPARQDEPATAPRQPGGFAKVLAKKTTPRQELKTGSGKETAEGAGEAKEKEKEKGTGEAELLEGAIDKERPRLAAEEEAGRLRQPSPALGQQPLPPEVRKTEGPSRLLESRAIQDLVREVVVAVNARGESEVRIELQSHTLEGLRIHIGKSEGQISVQFLTRSDQVAQFLNRNVETLAHALTMRGLKVGSVQVQSDPQPPRQERGREERGGQQRGGQGRGGQGRR